MLVAHAAHAEWMAREKTVLLASTHGEAAKATQRVSILGDELHAPSFGCYRGEDFEPDSQLVTGGCRGIV
jgi:hypothetical protein